MSSLANTMERIDKEVGKENKQPSKRKYQHIEEKDDDCNYLGDFPPSKMLKKERVSTKDAKNQTHSVEKSDVCIQLEEFPSEKTTKNGKRPSKDKKNAVRVKKSDVCIQLEDFPSEKTTKNGKRPSKDKINAVRVKKKVTPEEAKKKTKDREKKQQKTLLKKQESEAKKLERMLKLNERRQQKEVENKEKEERKKEKEKQRLEKIEMEKKAKEEREKEREKRRLERIEQQKIKQLKQEEKKAQSQKAFEAKLEKEKQLKVIKQEERKKRALEKEEAKKKAQLEKEAEMRKVWEAECKANYEKLTELDDENLVPNAEPFLCPICFLDVPSGEGAVLHDCLHSFCKECLSGLIQHCETALVRCPFQNDQYHCESYLQDREVKSLVTPELYEKHLQRSITMAESQARDSFHCKTSNCNGWCLYEDNVNTFLCPVCNKNNCLTCAAIHEGKTCKEYQDFIEFNSIINEDAKSTFNYLQSQVKSGDAMECPQCRIIIMKKEGCDFLTCSMCRTDICWATRGRRWGPLGKGDTSGGCRCNVNGVRCHPNCYNCH